MRVVVALMALVGGVFFSLAGWRLHEWRHARVCSDAGLGACALVETTWDGHHLVRRWRCSEWNNLSEGHSDY
jgi:hypothetical protein